MAAMIARIAVLALLALVCWLVVRAGRGYVESRRKAALRAEVLPVGALPEDGDDGTSVRILVFSSEDCAQCHRMQAPALDRVREARPGGVMIEEIDAPSSPDLTGRYHVMTVPTTVVLDASGRAHAVNYGFAGTGKLLEQVDAVLAARVVSDSLEPAQRI